MRKLGSGLVAMLVAVGICAGSPRALAATSDEQAIRALEERYVKAFNAKDVKGIMACFVEDQSLVVFDVVPPRQYVGPKAVAKDWEDFLAAFPGPLQVRRTDVSVTADDRVGFGHMVDLLSAIDKEGKKFELVARITHGYRNVNGKWLIVHEHVSVPVDLTTGKPDLLSKP